MCGIAGEIRFDSTYASPTAVERMLSRLESRGPDGTGLYNSNSMAFGHRRLKVIDLAECSSQPMVDTQLGLVIVYNGAIYNYHQLRNELENKGYQFFSNGDTEVILKSYAEWGEYCVERLNGMFAFAIWERDSKRMFLARDRSGIKPLYYQFRGKCFRFASTLPALLATGDVDTSIDPVALNYYMTFHSVVPAPHTIFNGVKKLPPATIMYIEPDGNYNIREYWKLNYTRNSEDLKCDLADWIDRIEEKLRESVEKRLVADVPVGVLLSGGLDSSLVVGLLDQAGQKDINTFSIGFENVAEEEGNEFRYSDLIAKKYSTNHTKIFADTEMVRENLADCIGSMSEPMVSHDVIGFYLLSKEVSKHVKVVQSGQGADEVFAGYHWYPALMNADPEQAVKLYSDVFFDRDFNEYKKAVNKSYIKSDFSSDFVKDKFLEHGAEESIDKALRIDTSIMLVDDPVKRVDNMTMAWGLEARVPFLDHELLELAAKIPAKYKVRDGGKFVLKEVGRRVIPNEVIDRPKGYFPVPALKYLEGQYLEMVSQLLNSDKAISRNIFNREYILMLFQNPKEHLTPLKGSKLWQIALLEHWLQENGL